MMMVMMVMTMMTIMMMVVMKKEEWEEEEDIGKDGCRVQPISPFYSRLTSYEQPASHIIVITLVEMIKTMEMIKGWQR